VATGLAVGNLSCGKYDTNLSASDEMLGLLPGLPQDLRIIVIMKRGPHRRRRKQQQSGERRRQDLAPFACQQRLFHAVKHSSKSTRSSKSCPKNVHSKLAAAKLFCRSVICD